MPVDDDSSQQPQQQQQNSPNTATSTAQGSPAPSQAASAVNAATNSSDSSKTPASSRFRSLALNAAKFSAPNGSPGRASSVAGSLSGSQPPPTGPLPPPPASDAPSDAHGAATTNGKTDGENPVPVPLSEMKSKLIYDIARTKMLARRTVIRMSNETGFIKLRSKPTPKPNVSGGAHSTNGTSAATAEYATKDGATAQSEYAKDAASAAAAYEHKAIAGWKEKGAIDSGKKSAPAAEPSFIDSIAPYVEMVDRSGMWRNCAGVFGLMFLTYVLTSLRFGIFGLAIVAAYGAQWYRNSIERYRRAVKDDLTRAYEKATITRTLESVGWLNEFVTRFWLMFEPSLSRMVIDIADPILAQNAPGFLDSLRLTTFTLGTKAPRIDGVRTYSELEDRNQIVMDWHASFTPNDLVDVPPVLRANRVNPKVVLTVRVGKGFIGAGMPILVEDMVFKGKMQVKLHLGPVFPHVRTADVCFLERPTIDFSLKPIGGDTFGFDIAHVPGLRTFILDMIHSTIGPMFYAPNHFTVDVEQIISGAVANIPSAKGVLIINMHSARGLPKMDTFGKADPYVKVSTIKRPDISVRTRTIEKTLEPSWEETMILLVYSKTDTIQLEVFDWNNVGKDDKIGFVSYPMQTLLEQPEAEGLTMPIKMGETNRGMLSFDMTYFPVAVRTTQAAAVDAEGNPLDPSVEAANAAVEEAAGADDEPEFDSNTGLLRLFVRSASNLAMTPALARKLNVRAEVFINKTKTPAIECPEVKGTDSPSWEVGKELFIPDRDCALIQLRLIDTSSHRAIGMLKLKVDDALAHQSGEHGSDWYPLEGHVKGQVRLNVKWRPILMDPDIASSLGGGKRLPGPPIGFVKLTCHEGRSLKNVEAASGRKSDPYMRVMVRNDIRGKTRYIANNLDPVWNETIFIPVHRINETLALECMDWNRVERDKPLGESILKVSRLMGMPTKDERGELVYVKTEPVEMWAGLRQRNGKIRGEIRFRAAFVPVINFDDMLSETDRASGMLDMHISDGGLVLGDEEPPTPDTSSHSSSSKYSELKHRDTLRVAGIAAKQHGNNKPNEPNGNNRPNEPNGAGTSSGVPGLKVAGASPPAMANMPKDDVRPTDSIFSGMTGPGGDTLSQTLNRYPRLPNIDYSQFQGGVLSVAVIGCRGLVRPFSGVFVNVYLNGNRQDPVIETMPSRRRGREHMWENEFAQTATPEAKFDALMFDLRCQPAGVDVDSDEMISIGKAEYSMKELLEQKLVNTPEPVWLPLDADTGEVLVFLRYDPVEDPELLASESITDQGLVRMRITSASNLPAADKSGTSDPYVVAFVDDVKVWESETIKKTLNPRWNQHAEVGIRQRSKTTLKLEVFDWNQIQSHTLLGRVVIPLNDLPISQALEKAYPLTASNGKATLELAFLFKPGYVEQHDDSTPVLLDVAHTVVKAPVTVIKGGASVVGNVVGGIFGKLNSKKPHFLGSSGKKHGDSDELDLLSAGAEKDGHLGGLGDRKLSEAAKLGMAAATNMPPDESPIQPERPAPARPQTAVAGSPSSIGKQATTIPMPQLSDSADSFPASGIVNISIESAELHADAGHHHHVRKRNLIVNVEMNHKSLHKTHVEKDTASAQWASERFALPVLQGGAPMLSVALKDHSSFRGDKTLAEFAVNVFEELKAELLKSNGKTGHKQVQLDKETASIVLSMEYVSRDVSGNSAGSDDAVETGSIAGSLLGRRGDRHKRRSSAFSRKSLK